MPIKHYLYNLRILCSIVRLRIVQSQTCRVNRKNAPTRKLRYLRNARISLYQILLVCLSHNCAKLCRFVLYLLDIHRIDGNANFRNEFCICRDCTKGRFCYWSNWVHNTTIVV